jgi:predicted MFS family arabinose efflux permease
MTFADLETVWKSTGNAPGRDQLQRYHEQLVLTIRKQRRASVVGLVLIGLVLALQVGAFVQFARGGGAFDVTREWSALLFLLLPVVVLAFVVRRYFVHLQRHESYTSSIADSLRTCLDDVRSQRSRLRMSMIGFTAGMLLLPLITAQLQEVGKQRPHEALSMALVFGVIYAVSMIGMALKWRKLRKERERLLQLIEDIDRPQSD